MKEALEILKKEYPLICDMSFEWGWKSCEEAMKHKECSKCKHIHQGWWCNENGIKVTLDFCCNRYKAKDTQC